MIILKQTCLVIPKWIERRMLYFMIGSYLDSIQEKFNVFKTHYIPKEHLIGSQWFLRNKFMLLPHSCSGPVLIFPFTGFKPAVLKAPVATCPPGALLKTLDGNHTPVISHTDTHSLYFTGEQCVWQQCPLQKCTHTFWTRRTGRIQGF